MGVSFVHEGWVRLFRNRPELAAELVRDVLGLPLPAYTEARIESGDLTDIKPASRYADAVVLLVEGQPVCGIIVEVQLEPDEDKLYSWPAYVANLRARIRCQVHLLVVTPSPDAARWAGREFELGHGARFRPLVVAPDGVPAVVDPERAVADPELSVLSAMAHGKTAPVEEALLIATTALDAVATLDADRGMLYSDLIMAALGAAARAALEALMTQGYEYQSEWARRHRAEGEAKGKAEGEAKGKAEGEAKGKAEGEAKGKAEGEARAVLTVLASRGLSVSADQRERVLGCRDLAELDGWLRKALVATATDDLFAG